MIYASQNRELIHDFWERLLLFRIERSSLLLLFVIFPLVFFSATTLSLLFGKSAAQFSLADEFSVMKGWHILGILTPIFLAPFLEELGWRGYGVDSLTSKFNLFYASLLFGLLWAIWHLPLFFVKGFYTYNLWHLNIAYVINYFISIIPVAILVNWTYYKNSRSILVAILAHAILNALSILFKTEQFTKCIVTLLLYGVATIVVVKDHEFFFKKPLHQMVKKELDLLRDQYRFPGATFAYVLPHGFMGSEATGLADVERKISMTPSSRMLAASIGKSFVAATILQLAKQERLKLDDPLSLWLGERPWFSRLPNHSTITLYHMLTHISGLPDHVHSPAFLEFYKRTWQNSNHAFEPESLVEFILDQSPLFNAGKGWRYSDTGYILLGLVIEKVTKKRYYQELEERFLRPLQLHATTPSDRPNLAQLAAGYTKEDNPFGLPCKSLCNSGVMAWNPAMEWTGGGLVSTSSDLARWAKLLFEGLAMKEVYLTDLLTPVPISNDQPGLYYGTGVVIKENDALGRIYGHYGIIPGYTSSIRYFPKEKVACAFQINTDVGIADYSTQLLEEMERRLSEIVLGYARRK